MGDNRMRKQRPMFMRAALIFPLISTKETLLRRHKGWLFISQMIIFHALFGLTITSHIIAATRKPFEPDPTRRPGFQSKTPTTAISYMLTSHESPNVNDADENVQLRFLRNPQWVSTRVAKDRPSPLPIKTGQLNKPAEEKTEDEDEDDSYYSPFPLGYSPPPRSSYPSPSRSSDPDEATDGSELNERSSTNITTTESESSPLLSPKTSRSSRPIQQVRIREPTSERRQWCKKCDAWKPDRCHHCSTCQQCVLKMDHHCPWVGNCIGAHNHKPFLLFVTYMPLLALYTLSQAGLELYLLFASNAVMKNTTVCRKDGICHDEAYIRIEALMCILMTILGGFFMLMLGGLAGYHWWLASTNKTTLEDISHSFPTALLDQWEDEGLLTPNRWRISDLSRIERNRLRTIARDINVYDLGWRVNLTHTLLGERHTADMDPEKYRDWRLRITPRLLGKALCPFSKVDPVGGVGMVFLYNPDQLERLKRITREIRFGVTPNSNEDDNGGR